MKISYYASALLIFSMFACSEGAENNTTVEENETEKVESDKRDENQASASETAKLSIEGNDQMQFNKNRFTVKAGQQVELTLKHVGTMEESAMGHNWILLQKGTDKAAFAEAAMQAKENDYIPQSREGDIIAHTEMIGGGETTTITFTAPSKGIYDFICSFPGHYAQMNGKFIVE